ncbi:hypothetical protein OROGR_018155 [Orobanche gracilis]
MMASNNKGKQNDDSKKRVPFSWTYESVLALCEILTRYLFANGRASPFNWVELQPEFEKIVKTELYSYKVLKNKYDEMRKDYSLCWNATTMTLSCSDEWWDKKIKENKRVRSFRKKQPTKELQEAWYNLFGDAVAGGVECVAPCMNPSTLNGGHNVDAEDVDVVDLEEDDDVNPRLENLQQQEENFYSSF